MRGQLYCRLAGLASGGAIPFGEVGNGEDDRSASTHLSIHDLCINALFPVTHNFGHHEMAHVVNRDRQRPASGKRDGVVGGKEKIRSGEE